jgi:hypothetical protein
MHPLTAAPQSAANTEQFEVIHNATETAVSRKTFKRLCCEMLISMLPIVGTLEITDGIE